MTMNNLSREEWIKLRRASIGSSDAAAACGESKVSPAELVLIKRGILGDPDLSNIEAVRWGRRLQGEIIGETIERLGLYVVGRAITEHWLTASGRTEVIGWLEGDEVMVRSVEHPWMTATLDWVGFCGDDLVVVEAKNVGIYHSHEWDQNNEMVPAKVDIQIAHQIAVTPALKTGILAALVGGNNLQIIQRRSSEIQSRINSVIAIEGECWKCVQDQSLPSWDGSESHLRAIRALHPMDTGETVALPDKATTWHAELNSIQPGHSRMGKRIKELRRNIEAAMNGATIGLMPDGSGRYSNRHKTRRSYIVPESSFPVLRFEPVL